MNQHARLTELAGSFMLGGVRPMGEGHAQVVIHRKIQLRSQSKDEYDRLVEQLIKNNWDATHGSLDVVSGGPTSSFPSKLKSLRPEFEKHLFLSSFTLKYRGA